MHGAAAYPPRPRLHPPHRGIGHQVSSSRCAQPSRRAERGPSWSRSRQRQGPDGRAARPRAAGGAARHSPRPPAGGTSGLSAAPRTPSRESCPVAVQKASLTILGESSTILLRYGAPLRKKGRPVRGEFHAGPRPLTEPRAGDPALIRVAAEFVVRNDWSYDDWVSWAYGSRCASGRRVKSSGSSSQRNR